MNIFFPSPKTKLKPVCHYMNGGWGGHRAVIEKRFRGQKSLLLKLSGSHAGMQSLSDFGARRSYFLPLRNI